ncbi:MAG: DUF2281 domain-containing protein [Nostocaceae cyanobacterium]|nr:DUF2281 domain-containing protein [Nostocaceae cyanobacterium]
MTTEQKLLEKWRELPQDKQEQVLEFVEFIHRKAKEQDQEKIKPTTPQGKGWMPGFFEEIIGGWVGEPLQRPEQGEYESREPLF